MTKAFPLALVYDIRWHNIVAKQLLIKVITLLSYADTDILTTYYFKLHLVVFEVI